MKTGIATGRNDAAVNKTTFWTRFWQDRTLLLMFLPGFALVLLFCYGPMYGLIIAFKDYNIGLGIMDSPWVGLKHFKTFFTDYSTLNVLKNTVLISLLRLVFGFPAPILLAIIINEIGNRHYKKIVQTISYLPHFISWIVVSGTIISLLSPSTGAVNAFIKSLGFEPIFFMTNTHWFRPILIITGIWKEVGWSAVIYLAVICGISPELYESSMIDGANRIKRILYITVPSLAPIVTVMLLLSMGGIMSAGFDQVFNMYNPTVYGVSDIIDTYVYRVGLGQMQYSFNTAVGLFKSVAGLALMLTVNALTRGLGSKDYGLL